MLFQKYMLSIQNIINQKDFTLILLFKYSFIFHCVDLCFVIIYGGIQWKFCR